MDTNIKRRPLPAGHTLDCGQADWLGAEYPENKHYPTADEVSLKEAARVFNEQRPGRINKLYPDAPEGRCTGRSTAMALLHIAQAIQSPNCWHTIFDHISKFEKNLELLYTIRKMVEQLNLQFFSYSINASSGRIQIRFSIFEEPK